MFLQIHVQSDEIFKTSPYTLQIPYKAGYCAYEEVLRTKWQDVFWCKYNFRQVFWLVCYFYSSGFRLFLTTSASNSVVVRLLSGESLWYIKFSI